MSGEFDLIDRYFRPLADASSDWLSDDCALVTGDKIISKDLLVANVHFLANDPAADIAAKALLSNLSDVISSGAQPQHYFLGLVLPPDIAEDWLAAFSKGLAEIQQRFDIKLAGGDITAGQQLMISVTMLGQLGERWVRRSGAKVGDLLCVTGVIGTAAYAVARALGRVNQMVSPDCEAQLARARNCPDVPKGIEGPLSQYASAALDISDGLIGDAEHLARASSVALYLYKDQIPVAEPLRQHFDGDNEFMELLLTGGDDFQVLFTVAPDQLEAMRADSQVPFSVVGEVKAGHGVNLLDRQAGNKLNYKTDGYRHF